MPIRKRTLDLAVDYIEEHFGRRFLMPIKPGQKFPPLIKDNLNMASNDPAQLAEWENQWPGCNWAVAHKKSNLLVVDVDCNEAKGKVGRATFDDIDMTYGPWPATETTTTPSGGFHLIYEGWENDQHPAFIFALGENGIGKDIDSPNYTLIPGCVFDNGTTYVGDGADAARCPEFVYDLIKTSKVKNRVSDAGEVVVELDQERNIALAIDFLRSDAEPAIEGSNGDLTTFKTFAYLKDIGISQSMSVDLVNEYYNPRCEPPWDRDGLEAKAASAYSYANLAKGGGKTAEADFGDDDARAEAATIVPMGIWDNESKSYRVDPSRVKRQRAERESAGKRERSKSKDPNEPKTKDEVLKRWVWITGMKRFIDREDPAGNYERNIWDTKQFDSHFNWILAPKRGSGADMLFREKTGGILKCYRPGFKPGEPMLLDGGTTFNMYRQPDIAAAEGDLTWWNAHLEYLLPNEVDRNHLLNWMAWLVQNLAAKPKHALILAGSETGTGKTFISRVLTRILHQGNVSVVPQTGLSGNFNAWAMQCKLIVIEELRAVDRGKVKETLHDIITEDTISIEKKGIDVFKIENCFGIFALTNDDAALQLDNTDRRYLVLRTFAKPRSPDYYAGLFARLRDDASMAAVAYSLLNRDLGEYSGASRAPMTEAKARMHQSGLSDLESFMLENRESWPFNARIVAVDDIIAELPKRLEARSARLYSQIRAILEREFGGLDLGSVRTPDGRRPRLMAVGPQAEFLKMQRPTTIGGIYADDKKNAAANKPLSDLEVDASEEFGQDDDVQ